MTEPSEWTGVPGADANVRTVTQTWRLARWPSPEAIGDLIDALGETMRTPLVRFCAINESLVRDLRGSWPRNRAKALAALRDGHHGHAITYFDVTSHNRGGYNWHPDSAVMIARIDDERGRVVMLAVERTLAEGEESVSIAENWAIAVGERFDVLEPPGAPLVGRHGGASRALYGNDQQPA